LRQVLHRLEVVPSCWWLVSRTTVVTAAAALAHELGALLLCACAIAVSIATQLYASVALSLACATCLL